MLNLSTAPLLELKNIHFSYDGRRKVLRDINIMVRAGSVVAIMGQSGGGKTTLLRLITGLSRPNSGEVIFDNHPVHLADVKQLYALRQNMGMLFQFGGLFTDLSVFDNIAFQLRERTDFPEEVIRDLVLMKLHAVGLRGTENLMPAQLSGGMARRVALARTIVLDPKLILYDEPFTGLDPISLSITCRLVRSLNDALHASSVIVTHDIESTMKIANYIYFISEGTILAHGTPKEMSNSDNPLVRQFIDGKIEGPVPFHYAAPDYRKQILGISQ